MRNRQRALGSAAAQCFNPLPAAHPRSANTGICHHLTDQDGTCQICGTSHPTDTPKATSKKRKLTGSSSVSGGVKPKQNLVVCRCIVKLVTIPRTTSVTPDPTAPALQAAQMAAACQDAVAAHPDVANTDTEKELLHAARSLPIPMQRELTKLATAVVRVRQSVPTDTTAASLIPEAARQSARRATSFDLTMAHMLALAPLPSDLLGHRWQLLRHAAAVVAVYDGQGEVAAAMAQQRTAEDAATRKALDQMAQQIKELQLQAGQPPARPASTLDTSSFNDLVVQVQAQRNPDDNATVDASVRKMVARQLVKEQLETVGSVARYLLDSVQRVHRCDELKKLGMPIGLAGDVLKLLDLG